MTVTVNDIALALGRTAPEDTPTASQWEMWIDDARMLIEARLGDLDLLNQDRLDYVVREAVKDHILRPDDATSVSVSADDGSSSRTYKSGRGRVTIRPEWWELLSPTKAKAFSVDTVPLAPLSVHMPWCSLMFGATYCSCGVDIAGTPIYELG